MKPDLLNRIHQLAGEKVARQIVAEFGGQTVSIRRSLSAGNMVLCRECIHLSEPATKWSSTYKCALDNRYVGIHARRYCDRHATETPSCPPCLDTTQDA